ncbi:uncharacterized mitochondrial protein AtMg00810-like [Lycium barbarum]|uniref:uncharacterized mitochondrial protein AtMg00810-like n=1 Tax=Lycium barbarum TaxID=112863 RepID=UPI00293EE446|nr:uncharacterized mitochondrial protein AtMg00810-like [Lycium barbarum]
MGCYTSALISSGYAQSKLDYSLFSKTNDSGMVIILVYVDDLLITGSSISLIQEAKDTLNHNFKMKDLGTLRYFLGIEFAKSTKGILMSQRKYALELTFECGLGGARPASTLLEQNQKLTSAEYDRLTETHGDKVLGDKTGYQRLVGKLLYLAVTRPDISFVLQCLSQFMHEPKESHWEAALHVVRYIKGQPGLGLLVSSRNSKSVVAHCDTDWASCSMTRRSITGYCVKLGDSLIS